MKKLKLNTRLIVWIAISIFAFACSEDEEVTNDGIKMKFDKESAEVKLAEEFTGTESVTVKVKSSVVLNLPASISVNLDASSTLSSDVATFSDIQLPAGVSETDFKVNINGEKIIAGDDPKTLVFKITSDDIEVIEPSTFTITVSKDLGVEIIYSSTIRIFDYDEFLWKEVESVTIDSLHTWETAFLDPFMTSESTSYGFWYNARRGDKDPKAVIETYGAPIAATAGSNGENFLTLFEAGDKIDHKKIDFWTDPNNADDPDFEGYPVFGPEWYNKTGYVALKAIHENVAMNVWIKVSVNENGTAFTAKEWAYEQQGYPLKAGQTE